MPVDTDCSIARLPLGRSGFSDIRKRGKIYVDKTALLARIAILDTPLFLSRPRRFGKSLLVDTLHCLFANGLRDFQGLAIDGQWQDRTYNVIRIDFSGMADSDPADLKNSLTDDLIDQFGVEETVSPLNAEGKYHYPSDILKKIARKLKDNSIVLLIDEYDAPLTHHLDKPNELQAIVQILNSFYAVVKEYTRKFRFIFITGITRIAHVSIFSAFNNLRDLSFENEYNTLLGFTQDELRRYFDGYVENAAYALGTTKDEVYVRLERYYDGFQFSMDAIETLYNPWSVLSFLQAPQNGYRNYWYQSGGTSSLIMQYLKIKDNFDFICYKDREKCIKLNQLQSRYDITNIPTEILLCQAGYFTARKETENIVKLTPPNGEVEESLLDLYFTANNIAMSLNVERRIDHIEEDIDAKNIDAVVSTFNAILNDGVSSSSNIFDDERSARDIIYSAIHRSISLEKNKERETVKGRSDLELITRKTRMVIEFKRTHPGGETGGAPRDAEASLAEAIAQIESRHYGEVPFCVQTLFRVAMVISTEEKRILPEYCREVWM